MACSEDDIRSYVSGHDIEVFSCFKTAPRRRRNQTVEDVNDRKTFRLCINAADRDHLLDPDIWPDSIRVSDWFFRNKNSQPADNEDRRVRQRINSPDNGTSLFGPIGVNKKSQQISDVTSDVISDVRFRSGAAVVTAVTATDTTTAADDAISDSIYTTVVDNSTVRGKDSDNDDQETITIYNHGKY